MIPVFSLSSILLGAADHLGGGPQHGAAAAPEAGGPEGPETPFLG
jgi:hypothetical protein